MHINHYDLSMAMNDVSDVNRKVERLEKRVETLERILAAHPERTAKATRKPEAFFYRCECGYGLCCEKNDMNYCPSCGARLEWE